MFAFALAQALILWPAAAHLLMTPAIAWGIAAASIALAVWLARPFTGFGPGHATAGAVGSEARPDEAAGGVRAAAWLGATAALLAALALWIASWRLVWARPVYDWDGLYYHLPALHGWAQAGRVLWIPGIPDLPFANGYPMAVEALGFLVHRMSGTSRLLDGGNLFWWPLAGLSLAVIAARLGASGPWRMAAAALVAAVPGWSILSTTSYVDPGFAAAAMATLAALLLADRADEAGAARHALLFGAAGGLMVGAKGQGIGFFAIALVAYVVTRARGRVASARRVAGLAALAVVAAGLAGGYWLVRNLVWSGNPIFPIEWKLGAKVLAAGYDTVALLGGNMPAWLREAPLWWRVPLAWTQPDAPIRGYAATGGLGWIWIFAGLPALVLAWAIARRRRSVRPLLLLTAVGAAWLILQPAPWWARMTLWLHALGLPALAFVLDDLGCARRRWFAWLAPFAILVVVTVGFGESFPAFEAERANGLGADGRYRSSAEALFPGLEEACPEVFAAPRIARGPWSRFGTLLGGVLAQPLEARRIDTIGDDGAPGAGALRAAGVEWIVWDEAHGPVPGALRDAALDSCAFRPAPDQRFLMLRIAPRP